MLSRLFTASTSTFVVLVTLASVGLAQEGPKSLPRPDDKPGAANKPIQVFILMGQSNMVGMVDIGPETTQGTLKFLTKKSKKYPWLVDGDKWTERKDVYYYDARVKKAIRSVQCEGRGLSRSVARSERFTKKPGLPSQPQR